MGTKFKIVFAVMFVALALSCSAGKPDAASRNTREVTDDLGNRVELPAEVTRAVSLAPNITEIVFAIGAGQKLVGVTTFCNYPEAAKAIQRVGDTLKPNVETIVALRPQVVFVSTASQLEAFTGLLEDRGISVFVTNPDSLDEVYRSISKIGDVLNARPNADALVRRMKKRADAIRQDIRGGEKPSVFVQIDPSLYTVGKGSYITDLVSMAGGRSVTSEIETAYPKVSREAALAYNPDVIIISVSPDNQKPNEVFSASKAVKSGRIVKIDADILSRPGPRIVEALELIHKGMFEGRKQRGD